MRNEYVRLVEASIARNTSEKEKLINDLLEYGFERDEESVDPDAGVIDAFYNEDKSSMIKFNEDGTFDFDIGLRHDKTEGFSNIDKIDLLKLIKKYISPNLQEEEESKQEFNSAKTSRKQVPALHKFLVKKNLIPDNAFVLDYGGGKFDLGKEYIETEVEGATLFVYDPFNRTEEHNNTVMAKVKSENPDVILLANVLNVIKEKNIRQNILKEIKKYKGNGKLYISVYEAPKKENYEETEAYVGQMTKDGWQNAQPTSYYLPEVKKIFPEAMIKNNIIIA